MIPGETIRSGASHVCKTCDVRLKLGVYRSAYGFFVGTHCNCGPYSRESHYYTSFELAKKALDTDTINWRT